MTQELMLFLKDLTIKKIHEGLKNKEFTAFELTKEFFDYIETRDKEVQAYLSLDKVGALAAAEAVDIAIAKGEDIGPLAGVPMAIKDNLLVKGLPATAGSKMLENYTAAYDATVIKKLKEAGAIVIGKANMDEFAMGSSTENSAFKITKNPHDLERVPGGSSGGSAAAVAAHMAVAALGTDTGGSIRQPASLCGVVGLKPTYGAVSRSGAIAMASSLDQIGPLTKTVEDAAIVFNAIKDKDPLDATSVDMEYGDDLLHPKLENVKKLRIGLPKEYFVEGMDEYTRAEVNKAIEKVKSLGIEVKDISLPNMKHALSCYYIIMPAEVSSNMARFDGIRYGRLDELQQDEPKSLLGIYHKQRGQGFGKEVRRRIMLGTYVLSSGYYDAYYAKAQKVRKLIKDDFDKAFEEVDVILTPVSPTTAFKIGEKTSDPMQMYLSDIFTLTLNLAGLPGVSIPVRQYEGTGQMPVGFQLIGKAFREADILGIGQFYERL
ncbi:MAG: Glutamyl-tRNA(Gln) amidotransferase subunit A [Candidatus Wolfebacteria bacterium GW2011_GWB2_46_69]|uniref:Glutamyl-tRNA(Gln) amidotransferase subunit A n=2 Tax=Candidatus Wolfeibacteriota TaxID=1752735 RepID=A0A0G4AS69_9BACT|nr:MAG: aspartyl/glutamyl-tRNA amidotransferase subunit A, aspartyl-tRNA(Asn)/glutamyl-tRNA (Gln) amidotransferase subunit A [Candidatus Wolfebacteria bacterium GW2011_GWB1_47_1]KKU41078.1 MAG: Glutamyl-tRNA(Gln) amidotransferase subunit A [Candidatus Wolfebacteria bacterium GW2011_GWB2_46_69]KKU53257.1 MAG: Glutamyl-tRNA(Gln) amidotransferase subunit A [Candidatus Wolfebacteria bacterium GW2011_GWC1_47_103]KKU59125.1 MAG: Glutamyl-tRNA(Gln) amidotransferase subunit A [Candidatus Wolfebacteria b